MPSDSLDTWNIVRMPALIQIDQAIKQIGGIARGRRYTTRQLNYSYLVAIAAEFQGYCRDLHDECINKLATGVVDQYMQSLFVDSMRRRRVLNTGNADIRAIQTDFGRFSFPPGQTIWHLMEQLHPRQGVEKRKKRLSALNHWRNAIVHRDFISNTGGNETLLLRDVHVYHKNCKRLTLMLDRTMNEHMLRRTGHQPWRT